MKLAAVLFAIAATALPSAGQTHKHKTTIGQTFTVTLIENQSVASCEYLQKLIDEVFTCHASIIVVANTDPNRAVRFSVTYTTLDGQQHIDLATVATVTYDPNDSFATDSIVPVADIDPAKTLVVATLLTPGESLNVVAAD